MFRLKAYLLLGKVKTSRESDGSSTTIQETRDVLVDHENGGCQHFVKTEHFVTFASLAVQDKKKCIVMILVNDYLEYNSVHV